jgi:hypothetical protein
VEIVKPIIIFALLTVPSAFAEEIECRSADGFDFSLAEEISNISAIKNSLGTACSDQNAAIVAALEQEYRTLYPYRNEITRVIRGVSLTGTQEELSALESILGRKPPSTWLNAKDCRTVDCAVEKIFNSREAGLRALIIHKRDGLTISASQDYPLAERVFKTEEVRKIDLILRTLPAQFKQKAKQDLKEIRRTVDASYNPKLMQTAAAYARTDCQCIEYYDGAFKSEDESFRIITHELAHFRDGFDSPSKKSEYRSLGGWGDEHVTRLPNGDAKLEYDRDKSKKLVTEYAGTAPGEDFADSVAAYVVRPHNLEAVDPAKYAFLREKIFEGTEFKQQSWPEMERLLAQVDGDFFINSCLSAVNNYAISAKDSMAGFDKFYYKDVSSNCLTKVVDDLVKNNPNLCVPNGAEAIRLLLARQELRQIKFADELISGNHIPIAADRCTQRNDFTAKCISEEALQLLIAAGTASSSDRSESVEPIIKSMLEKANRDLSSHQFDFKQPADAFGNCILDRARAVGANLFNLAKFTGKTSSFPDCENAVRKTLTAQGVKIDENSMSKRLIEKSLKKTTDEYWSFHKEVITPYISRSGRCDNTICREELAANLMLSWGQKQGFDEFLLHDLAELAKKSAH